jgi:hypothetical protein
MPTTGTGSGKSLAYFIPIVDAVLKARADDPAPRTRAIVIYPMNARSIVAGYRRIPLAAIRFSFS